MASLKFKEILCLLYCGVLFVSGAILVGFVIVLSYKLFYHFKFVPSEAISPFGILILLGICHLSSTWMGVKGPSKEHDFFILAFAVLSLIMMIVEITVGIWSMVLWAEIEEKSVEIMKDSQLGYFKHNYDKNDWVRLENRLHCCGLNGTQDYREKGDIPISCFKCDDDIYSKNKSCVETYVIGCRGPFVKYVENILLQVALVAFFSGILQVAGVASFVIFYKGLKEERVTRAAARATRLRQSLSYSRTPPNPSTSTNANAPSSPT